ncbi:MAG: hypothetical protein NVS4B11_23230 [Ktedonobacteraceae bacterium]
MSVVNLTRSREWEGTELPDSWTLNAAGGVSQGWSIASRPIGAGGMGYDLAPSCKPSTAAQRDNGSKNGYDTA